MRGTTQALRQEKGDSFLPLPSFYSGLMDWRMPTHLGKDHLWVPLTLTLISPQMLTPTRGNSVSSGHTVAQADP